MRTVFVWALPEVLSLRTYGQQGGNSESDLENQEDGARKSHLGLKFEVLR